MLFPYAGAEVDYGDALILDGQLALNPPFSPLRRPSDDAFRDARSTTRSDDKLIHVCRFGTVRRASLVTFHH